LNNIARSGNLIIVSGPSGAGKSALADRVLQAMPEVHFSVSYTTRAPRRGERHGVEYCFVSKREFESLVKRDDLLEWAEVHGNCYGTSRTLVDDFLQKGEDVLLDIDIQGAQTIRRKRPDAIGVFILPPSHRILRERLERRGLDDGRVIAQRLEIACKEISHYRDYDYLIINNDLDSSAHELQAIILSARCRVAARIGTAESILATFGGMDAEDP
jgi:guanylate kinase